MKRFFIRFPGRMLIFIGLVAAGMSLAGAQEVPREFTLLRETKDGVPGVILLSNSAAFEEASVNKKPLQILGGMAAPRSNLYLMIYFHLKPSRELMNNLDNPCAIQIGNDKFEYRIAFERTRSDQQKGMWFESLMLKIDRAAFEKLTTAKAAQFHCGTIRYTLTKNNIDALHQLGREAAKITLPLLPGIDKIPEL